MEFKHLQQKEENKTATQRIMAQHVFLKNRDFQLGRQLELQRQLEAVRKVELYRKVKVIQIRFHQIQQIQSRL